MGKNRMLGIYWALLLALVLPFGLTLSRALVPMTPPDFATSPTPLGYTFSLSIFIIPLLLFWVWLKLHPSYPIEKKVYLYTVLGILGFGSLLDLLLGHSFFYFPNPTAVVGVLLPAFSLASWSWVPAYLPIEEFGFYLFGGTYMISLYLWGMLYWFRRYNPPNHAHAAKHLDKICSLNLKPLVLACLLVVLGYVFKKHVSPHPDGFPGYYSFLILLACLPCMVLYDVCKYLINWRAFTFMSFMLLLVSVVYEATLGVPYGWWQYHDEQMVGLYLTGWSNLPIEAVMLWVAAGFGTVLVYEALRLFFYMDDRSARAALFGHPRGSPRRGKNADDLFYGSPDAQTDERPSHLPVYVDDGVGLPVPRGPYANPRVDMANFLIKVDPAKVRLICDRYLNDVLNNHLKYIPFLSVVLLTYAKIVGYALDDQQQKMGLLPENDLVIWIPTIAVRSVLGVPVPTHLAMFPYRLYVDSAYGLSAGREVFGFQKTFAAFNAVPDIKTPNVTVQTLAFPTYAPEHYGQMVATIRVRPPGEAASQSGPTFATKDDCWAGFFTFLLGPKRSHLATSGLDALAQFFVGTFKPATTSVSIKQLRDVQFPLHACFQQVIEARSEIQQFFGGGLLLGERQIDFATLASDPFVRDLGIELVDGQQTVGLGFWVSVAFTMQLGKVIG